MLYENDVLLLDQIRSGNTAAFTMLYKQYQPLLVKEAYHKLRNIQEAEDAVQEIFTSFWHRRKELSISSSIKHYLLRAVHLQYAYKCRKNTVARKFVDQAYYVTPEGIQPRHLENKELGMQIKKAINSVSAPACRKVFELYYIQD